MSVHGYRFVFRWRWPRVVIVRPAERRTRIALNRYPGIVIGLVFQVGRRGLSLLWGRPDGLTADSCVWCFDRVSHAGRYTVAERDADRAGAGRGEQG